MRRVPGLCFPSAAAPRGRPQPVVALALALKNNVTIESTKLIKLIITDIQTINTKQYYNAKPEGGACTGEHCPTCRLRSDAPDT